MSEESSKKNTLGMYVEIIKLITLPTLKGAFNASWYEDLDNCKSTNGKLLFLKSGAIS